MADDKLNISRFNRIIETTKQTQKTVANKTKALTQNRQTFADVLQNTLNTNNTVKNFSIIQQSRPREIVFSKHAQQRLGERGIEVDEFLLEKLGEAVSKAASKNIKNALVLGNDEAFIINIANNTVVTAMSYNEMRSNIVTNIDGTVIL